MPELPEVQTVVDDLNAARITDRVITRVIVYWPATIDNLTPFKFSRSLKGRMIKSIHRRGKFILFDLDDSSVLAVHLRMSGRFLMAGTPKPPPRHVHVILGFDDRRQLWFQDTRKFGRFYLAHDVQTICGHLGPEPLGPQFTRRTLRSLLAKYRRQLKPLLLDQTVIAGLGNIYVDEALWAASLNPLRSSDTLSGEEIKRLYRAIRSVLRQGIKNAGTSLGKGLNNYTRMGESAGENASHLKVFRRTGSPCKRCSQSIERIRVGQRSTHYCPVCQPNAVDI
jgi:formamidopyrimidine-DNA glycosylase